MVSQIDFQIYGVSVYYPIYLGSSNIIVHDILTTYIHISGGDTSFGRFYDSSLLKKPRFNYTLNGIPIESRN